MTGPVVDRPVDRPGVFSRLYNGQTNVRFVGRWKLWLTVSAVIIAIGLGALVNRGLNLGIDFEGGSVWEVVSDDLSVEDARSVAESAGLTNPEVQSLTSGDERRIRVSAEPEGSAEERVTQEREVAQALADASDTEPGDVSVTSVGPSWGDEITKKARQALIVFLIAIVIYITLRFEWKMAVPTLAALLHDILVTVGVYAVFGFEVTPATVIALLTILGYSIYDGIVVFDKVDENSRLLASSGRMTYSEMVDASLNQVLMRTLNTSITALIPIASLLFIGAFLLGAETLEEFALALFVGLGASMYSSIFIASPLLALLKEREPRYRALRERLARRAGVAEPAMAGAGAGAGTIGDVREGPSAGGSGARPKGAVPPRPSTPAGAIPPRPRKKRRKR